MTRPRARPHSSQGLYLSSREYFDAGCKRPHARSLTPAYIDRQAILLDFLVLMSEIEKSYDLP